jgi:hypothetical protein
MSQRLSGARSLPARTDGRLDAEVELVNLSSIRAEMDDAFASLRLAKAAIRADHNAEAAELIKKAIFTHKSVVQKLGCLLSSVLHEEQLGLQQDAERLLEAIRGVERQFQVLLDADPHQNSAT